MSRNDLLELVGIALLVVALGALSYGLWQLAPVAVWFVAAALFGVVGIACVGLANRGGA